MARGQRALALGTATEDDGLTVMPRFYLGIVSLCVGRLADAVELLRQVGTALVGGRAAERFGEPGPPAQFARAFLAWTLAELGRLHDAVAVGDDSLRMAQAVDEPFTLMHGYFGAGIPYLARGDFARAIPPLERGVALCRAADLHLWSGETAAELGLAYARAGRIADALPVLEFALEEATTTGLQWTYARQHALVGEAYLLAGRRTEAARLAEIALQAARTAKQRGQEAMALRLSAEIAADALEAERAATDYRAALALASELRMRPLVAHCHLGLGKLYHRAGQRDQAQEHLTTATTLYREMDMRFWLEQAEAEMRDSA
jgi:tetratricopeptide (TPR) repeat protein